MFFYIAILFSIAGLIGATYTDLKERIVPNKLNFGLAIAGLLIFGAQTVYIILTEGLSAQAFYPIMFSFFGLCTGFFFGWIMWKAGVFAGGDVKLFMGLGALNPFTPALLNIGIFSSINIPIFPLTLFIYSLFAFFPYGLIMVLYKLKKNPEFRKQVTADLKKRSVQATHVALFASSCYTILNYFNVTSLITIPLLFAWGFTKNTKKFFTIAVFVVALILNYSIALQSFVGSAIMLVVVYGVIKLLFSLRPLLSTKISLSKLEEGMIPSKTLVWKGKKIIEKDFSIQKIISLAKKGKIKELFSREKEIVSANKARGLIKEEIKEIKLLAKKGIIPKTIMIKESMPFVPTMLIGYLLCIILGDAVWFILGL